MRRFLKCFGFFFALFVAGICTTEIYALEQAKEDYSNNQEIVEEIQEDPFILDEDIDSEMETTENPGTDTNINPEDDIQGEEDSDENVSADVNNKIPEDSEEPEDSADQNLEGSDDLQEEEKPNEDLEDEKQDDEDIEDTIKNGWSEDGTQYFIEGELQYGLVEIEGHKYYFDENGYLVHGFVTLKIDGVTRTCYFDEEGKLVSGLYTVEENNQSSSYYFDENGYLYYGQLYLNNYWYYFKPETGQMATGITTILPEYNNGTSKTVYYDSLGHLYYGQIQIDGKWYYFQPDTGQMATGGVYTIAGQYANGIDQISVYDANGVRLYGQVKSKNIVYHIDSNGYVTKVEISGIGYLSQTDSRWAYTYVGNYNMSESGCFPTVLTMVVNFLMDKNFTPVEIGKLLYSAQVFNYGGVGTSSEAVRFLTDYFGLYFDNNLGYEGMVDALKKGYIVVGSVGPGYWTIPGYTHAILLFGYEKGNTHVYDPYDSKKCGLFSIAYIWAQRSTVAGDNLDGGPFFAVSYKEKFEFNKNDFNGTFEVVVGKEDNKTHNVVIYVWTSQSGEENRKTYTYKLSANEYYTLKETVANFGNYFGQYFIRVLFDGRLVIDKSFILSDSSADVTVTDTNGKETIFDVSVVINNVPTEMGSVQAAVWSDNKGQDDIRWITLTKKSNGKWSANINISDFVGLGLYNVHVYVNMPNGKRIMVDTSSFFINQPTWVISIENYDQNKGSFDVVVSDINSPSGVTQIQVPVWSEVNGQDDIRWYTATKQADGTYKVTVYVANHKLSVGKYNVHSYLTGGNGQRNCVVSTGINVVMPQSEMIISNDSDTMIQAILLNSNVYGNVSSVRFAVWSTINGQDDLKWITAKKQGNGSWLLNFNIQDFKSYGEYNVHAYVVLADKTQKFATKDVFEIAKPIGNFEITNVDNVNGSFDVVITDIQSNSGVSKVEVPVWTQINGQDDIRWYTAAKQSDGTYKVTISMTNHKYETGLYNIHVYVTGNNGLKALVGAKTTTVNVAEPVLTIENINQQDTTIKVILSNPAVYGNVSSVQFAVWSTANGQDDLHWLMGKKQTDGSWLVSFNIKDYKSYGEYNVHAYVVLADKTQKFVTKDVFEVAQPTGNFEITNVDNVNGSFDVVITDIQSNSGVSKVEVPVWTQINGQDDIRWYTAAKQSDGTYKVTISMTNHKYETGLYNVHVYVTGNNGLKSCVKTDVINLVKA